MKQLLLMLVLLAALVGCADGGAAVLGVAENGNAAVAQLTADYPDALSIQGQLALGTIQLEETALALDETQAAALLPLWQALATLGRSDTAAVAEINAVVKQLAEGLTPAQIAAIAAMKLTADDVAALQESGVLTSARRQGGGAGSLTGASGRGGMGGGMGGGIPGVGPDPSAQATRQAQSGDSGANASEQMLTNAVLRLLQTKAGVAMDNRSGMFEEMWQILGAAAGLEVTELRDQMAAGETPAALIVANGGDVTAVADQLRIALEATDLSQTQELDSFIYELLYGHQQE